MARFFIIDAVTGIGDGGFACGPVSGPVVAEAHIRDESGDECYISLCEFEGIPMFFKTDESTYQLQTSAFDEDDAEYLSAHEIHLGDYGDIFSEPDNELYDLARYLIYLVRCELGEEQPFIDKTKSHWTDEIDIPMSDQEEEWLAELEEED